MTDNIGEYILTSREIAEFAAAIIASPNTTKRGHIAVVGELMVAILNEPGTNRHAYLWETACGDITRYIENTYIANGGTGDKFYEIKAAILSVERDQLLKLLSTLNTQQSNN